MKFQHSHPINIVEHTCKNLIFLLLPILRALYAALFTDMTFWEWLDGVWFDILVVALIFLFGLLLWLGLSYRLTEAGIEMRKGILLRQYRMIPYRRLSIISVENPWYLRPLHVVRITVDTDGGPPTASDFSITLHQRDADPLLKQASAPFVVASELRRVYLPKNFYIAVLSFVASNTLTGVIYVATLFSGSGKVLGEQFEREFMRQLTSLTQLLAFGLPPTAAFIAYVILGGWLISFLLNLIRHLRFSVTRQSGQLTVESGLFTKHSHQIAVKRINLLELRQSLLTKLGGFYSVMIHVNGYGKKKDELSVLMPAGENEELSQNLDLLLPELPVGKPVLRPKFNYLSRFLIPPITWIAAVSLLWALAWNLFPSWQYITLYVGIMIEIPCFWYLFVKIASYLHTGIGIAPDSLTFSYTYAFRFKTVVVPKRKVIKMTVRRSLFQVMSGCCDLVILTFSEGRKRHVVPNLDYSEVRKMLELEHYCKASRPLAEILLGKWRQLTKRTSPK